MLFILGHFLHGQMHSTLSGMQEVPHSESRVSGAAQTLPGVTRDCQVSRRPSLTRVCTDLGKSWNLKFKFSMPGKSLELGLGPGKSQKIMENKPNGCHISELCTFSAFTVRSVV